MTHEPKRIAVLPFLIALSVVAERFLGGLVAPAFEDTG